ncbi:MAG: hypothetical protein ACP5E3_00510, partial [Bacteroidales bacterium]
MSEGQLYLDTLTGNLYGYSPTGNILIGGPDFHVRNTDTKLAEGTGDEVTAIELRSRLDEALFSGSFDDLIDKPVTIPSPPTPLKLRTYNGVSIKQIDTISLVGTSGTADITGAGGLTKTLTFDTNLTVTASNFVTSFASDYLAKGIVVTSDGASLVFTAETAGVPFTSPIFINTSGDLDGNVSNTQANQTSEEFWTDEHIWAMNVHEGRFSATYDGNVTKMWLFPAGTTDTTTGAPVRTSVDDTVDVQIPADGGTVYLAVDEWDTDPAVTFTIIEAHGTPGNKIDMFYKHKGELDLSASNSFKGAWPEPDGTYYMCEKMDLSGTAMTGTDNANTLANLASYWAGKTVTGGFIILNNDATGLDAQTDIDTLTTAGFTVSAVLLPSSEPVGSGTIDDPYLIGTLEELTWITIQVSEGNQFINKYFKQTANIDASDTQTWNGGWLPIGNSTYPFAGYYDGDSYSITGLYINKSS